MDLKVGIQLFSVKEAMQKDPVEAIRKVASLGYKNLEFANHRAAEDPGVGFGVSVEEMKALLDETGSHAISAHVGPLNEETIDSVIAYHRAIGSDTLVIPMAFYESEEDAHAKAAEFNRLGQRCRENGMRLLYHNHYHEFQKLGEKTVMEILAEDCEPENLGFELDTFWIMRSGHDPIEVMKKLGTRVKMIHQKDFSKTSPSAVDVLSLAEPGKPITRETFGKFTSQEDFTEIGEGIMNIQAIIDAARELGSVEYIILEQDATQKTEMESIEVSFGNLKKYNGIV